MRATLVLALLLGCSEPPLKLVIAVSEVDKVSCKGETCADVTMKCNAVVGVRIVDPSDPTVPYQTICQDVLFNQDRYLCSLNQLELDSKILLPVDTLEVQVVVFPADDLYRDVDGDPICPATVMFDGANGFPLASVKTSNPLDPSETKTARPAIGGRGFWHPGDAQVRVELGCFDLPALNAPTCEGIRTVAVRGQVIDFDSNQQVEPDFANRLYIGVGEPQLVTVPNGDLEYELFPADTTELERVVVGPIPVWQADVAHEFGSVACLQVLDSGPATPALTCKSATSMTTSIDIVGTLLRKETLDAILLAAGSPTLDKGLTIGIVLDDAGPSAGRTISLQPAGSGTIRYLSADGSNFNATTTTAAGIFISEDAPFGTQFETTKGSDLATGIGGLVNNKITIVPLRFVTPPVGVR